MHHSQRHFRFVSNSNRTTVSLKGEAPTFVPVPPTNALDLHRHLIITRPQPTTLCRLRRVLRAAAAAPAGVSRPRAAAPPWPDAGRSRPRPEKPGPSAGRLSLSGRRGIWHRPAISGAADGAAAAAAAAIPPSGPAALGRR